jgi:PAS domain S-box-containing protein
VILSGKQQFVLHDPIKIVTFSGDELAEGWILQAALWDGERVIGYISTDNALRHQPVQLYQKELLSVFGSMVGNLYTRKRSEIALRESEERYRRISELVSDYAFSFHVNADGTQTVDWLIGSPIQLTGYDNAELTRARGAYHPEEEERVRGDLERTLQGSPTEGDYRIITKDGDVRWIRVRRQPVWDAKENRVTRFYGAVQDVTQRRQAGDLLRQSEERYRTLFDQSRDGIFISSRNGSILDANQAIVDLTGYTRDELAVLEAVDLYVNPEDRFAFQQDIEQHGSVTDYEVTLKRKDGTLRTCLVSATVRRSQNGTILGYQGSTRDITAQKRAQEALRLNEEIRRQFLEKLRTLHDVEIQLSKTESFDELCRQAVEFGRNRLGFDRFSVWFVDSDPEYMVGSFGTSEHGIVRDERNQRVKITFGADMTEILDGRVLISTGDDSPVFDDQLRVVGQGWKAAAKLWVADRTIGWLFTDNLFRHEPVSDYQLELLALYAATIGHLATAKRTLENLLYSESRLRQAMRLARLGMWEWDIASDKTTWSEEMFEMYGITAEQFTGKGEDYFSFTHEDDRETQRDNIRRAFERTATASSADANKFEPDPKEFRIVRPDGTICYTRGDAVAIVDNEGRPVQMFGILMDITERKFAENQALELALTREREQNLKNFIDTLSHDLKTPLTVIKTGLYLLERIPDPESQSDKIALISRQVTLLEKYIMDLLTISRLDHLPELTHQAVNLNDLVEDIASRLRTTIEQKSLAITLDLAQTPATVFGDADQLDRMLVNLIENAVSYTPSNGSISVRTNVEEQHVVVQIIDSGIGINDTELPRIFDRFYRSAEAQEVSKFGSGLGLAIVKRILDLHAGDIEVQSRVGQGTMFRVWMPIGVPTPFHQKSDHTRSS